MPAQIPLNLALRPDYRSTRFVSGQSNAEARDALLQFPNWPHGALALIGDAGTGKTHLGHGWIGDHNGLALSPSESLASAAKWRGRALWVDNASTASEELLFGLINMAHAKDITGLLLTDRRLPSQWSVAIPDLRSRLGALQVARIDPPDDALLSAIYDKLFLDRGLKVNEALISYLMLRVERSVDAARSVVAALDQAAAEQKVNVNRSFASKIIDEAY